VRLARAQIAIEGAGKSLEDRSLLIVSLGGHDNMLYIRLSCVYRLFSWGLAENVSDNLS
jgi:hypothetical protein